MLGYASFSSSMHALYNNQPPFHIVTYIYTKLDKAIFKVPCPKDFDSFFPAAFSTRQKTLPRHACRWSFVAVTEELQK